MSAKSSNAHKPVKWEQMWIDAIVPGFKKVEKTETWTSLTYTEANTWAQAGSVDPNVC